MSQSIEFTVTAERWQIDESNVDFYHVLVIDHRTGQKTRARVLGHYLVNFASCVANAMLQVDSYPEMYVPRDRWVWGADWAGTRIGHELERQGLLVR